MDPETVIERAQEAPPETRGMWLGIAAEACFARGDELGTVRLLKMAYAEKGDLIGPHMSTTAIRGSASDELQETLDKLDL